MRKRAILALATALCVAGFATVSATAKKKTVAETREFLKQIPDDQKILQALNRLTFGPRPGDAQAVRTIGFKK
jgi:hypothetical protein